MPTVDRRKARQLAWRVVAKLFVNGVGEGADRLILWKDDKTFPHGLAQHGVNGRDLGGWCIRAVVDQVTDVLCPPKKRKGRS